jgi:PEGA domain
MRFSQASYGPRCSRTSGATGKPQLENGVLLNGIGKGVEMNTNAVRQASLLLFLMPLWTCVLMAQTARNFKIPDGTSLRLALTESLSSATNEVDNPVGFEVTEDVTIGDVIALPRGSTAIGHVVEAEPRRRMGRAGKLNFSVDHVKAPDGTNVRLRATSTRKGDDKTGTVIVGAVLLSPLFLIMRGKDITIPKGTVFTAYVDGDREIALGAGPNKTPTSPPTNEPGQSSQFSPVSIRSVPDGADITVDGKYVGSTPAAVQLAPGDHTIAIEKSDFQALGANHYGHSGFNSKRQSQS